MDSQIVVIIVIVFSMFEFLCSSVNSKSITLSLSQPKHFSSSSSKKEELHRLVRASSARAQSFKRSKLIDEEDDIQLPLFPRGYGGYSLSLSFGKPPQTLPFLMDTGSSLTWFPCTADFTCEDCNFRGVGTILPFIPQESSSSKNVPCDSTQCKWLFPDLECTSQELDCGYNITYGQGEIMGLLLSEILNFPDDKTRFDIDDFIVGCSLRAYYTPSGIAGFGRARYSLPSQMELDSFSYCLLSHDFDDNNTMSSDLVLITKGGGGGGGGSNGSEIVHYTPLIHNQIHEDFYYVRLQNITVGNVINITVPDVYQVPDVEGNGGTIVDSGTTLTVMEESVFDLVTKEFESQIIGKNNSNSRNTTAESETGLGLCLNVWSLDDIPTLSLLFQGGAVMNLPMQNYFLNVEDSVVCLMMTSISGRGPAIILGNYLQQNFYVEYGLKNNLLGFLKRICIAK